MATIYTAIQIQDRATPALRSIHDILRVVIDDFQTLSRAARAPVEAEAVVVAGKALRGVEVSKRVAQNNIEQACREQQGFTELLRPAGSLSKSLARNIGAPPPAVARVLKITASTSAALKAPGADTRRNESGSASKATRDNRYQAARPTRISDVGDQATARIKMEYLFSFVPRDATEQIARPHLLAESGARRVAAAWPQADQSMAAGAAQGERFAAAVRQAWAEAQRPQGAFAETNESGVRSAPCAVAPPAAALAATQSPDANLARSPVTLEKIKSDVERRATRVFDPLLAEVNQLADGPALTRLVAVFSGAMAQIAASGNFADLLDSVNGAINQLAGNAALTAFAANVGLGLADAAGCAARLIGVIGDIAGFFLDHWGVVAPIVMGIAGAFYAYSAAVAICNTVSGVMAFLEQLKAARLLFSANATLFQVAATNLGTGAQIGFNAAILACPIFWIIAAVVAFIGILYAAVAAYNALTGSSVSATGIIVGCFAGLAAMVYNCFVVIWNICAAFIEFFMNANLDGTYAAKMLFVNLATAVLDIVASMTKGFDAFATNMANSIMRAVVKGIGWFNEMLAKVNELAGTSFAPLEVSAFQTTSITSEIENLASNLKNWAGSKPAGYREIKRLESVSIEAVVKDSYNKTKKMTDGFGKPKENPLAPDPARPDPAATAMEAIKRNVAGSADRGALPVAASTRAGTAGEVPRLSDEEASLLREMAQKEIINRFTTAEIKLEMTNHNSVSGEVDIDGMIATIGTRLAEHLQSAAEGVHV